MINRPHLFRIWDQDFKQISSPYNLGDTVIRFPKFNFDLSDIINFTEMDRFTILPYIGQNDKEGTPIHEGHILSGPYANGSHRKDLRTKDFNFVATWYNDAAEWQKYSFGCINHNVNPYRTLPHWDECKIIGHIFTNPELLKKPIQFPLTPF